MIFLYTWWFSIAMSNYLRVFKFYHEFIDTIQLSKYSWVILDTLFDSSGWKLNILFLLLPSSPTPTGRLNFKIEHIVVIGIWTPNKWGYGGDFTHDIFLAGGVPTSRMKVYHIPLEIQDFFCGRLPSVFHLHAGICWISPHIFVSLIPASGFSVKSRLSCLNHNDMIIRWFINPMNTILVGGLEHGFYFSIIYGIILPID